MRLGHQSEVGVADAQAEVEGRAVRRDPEDLLSAEQFRVEAEQYVLVGGHDHWLDGGHGTPVGNGRVAGQTVRGR
jgi:hypothetical protein